LKDENHSGKHMTKINASVKGVGFLVLAMMIISIQNIAVKWIGGDYSALEIVAVRSLVALPCTLLFYRYEGQRGLPTTQQPKLECLRGVFLFLS
jgi:S-adenosylmethionine uptake transporter